MREIQASDAVHHFTMQVSAQEADAKGTAVELSGISISGDQCGACLWGCNALAVLQPAGALSAVRLDKPNHSLEIAQCSSDCVIKSLPAKAPGKALKDGCKSTRIPGPYAS